MANQISFVEILAPGSRGLGAFYHDAFGWDVYEPAGSMEYRVMNPNGDNGVMAAIGDPFVDGEAWLCFYVMVDDIDAAVERAVAAGGSVKVPKYATDTGFTLAYVCDPAGHVIGLQQPGA